MNPMFRFLEREVTVTSNLLELIRKNLNNLKAMAEGKLQPLQELKNLSKIVYAGNIPETWKKYVLPVGLNITQFIADFKKRLTQFLKLTTTSNWQKKGVWLGGLLFPEAFMTATRQYVSQNNNASLDELELKVSIWDGKEVDDDSFLLEGLYIQGSKWEGENLGTTVTLTNPLKTVKCTWMKINVRDKGRCGENEIFVPVYLNNSRKKLIMSVKLNCKGMTKNYLYQRGCALIAWQI